MDEIAAQQFRQCALLIVKGSGRDASSRGYRPR